jgi:hypothetical protein
MNKQTHNILLLFQVIIFLILLNYSLDAFPQGQCLGGGCTGGYQYPSGTLSSNTNSWTPVSTNNWAGEYGVYNVTSGSTYEWSLLSADGGFCSYDGQLTLLDNSGATIICFSDDYYLLLPKIQWTATFTGTVRVLLTAYSGSGCQTNTTATTIVWRCFSCGNGSAPANDNCSGAIALTVNAAATAGTVSGATNSLVTGCSGTAEDDVWYKFTTSTAGYYTITAVGSASFDAVIDLRSGACNGTNVACADNSNSGGTEILTASLAATTTYYIRVYDYYSTPPSTLTFTIQVTKPATCTPYTTYGTSSGDYINNVTLSTINNTTGAGSYYTDYFPTVSTSLVAGTSQTLNVTVGTYGGQTVAAWIDYNQDGDFSDAGESLGEVTSVAASSVASINFTIPVSATSGNCRMRVRNVWSITALDPCATYGWGEAEDYKIIITPACTTPGTPATLSTSGITISQAQLNWTAGTPAGSATVTYYWAIGAASNVTYEANYLFRGTTTSLNAIQATLNPGTTYYWTVKAVTSCNGTISAYASAISFVTSCTTPSSPTALNTTNISTTSATFNWTASATGSPAISYYWAVGTGSGVTYDAGYTDRGIATSLTATSFSLIANTTYYWTVKAETSCNATASSYPSSISLTTLSVATPLITWNGNTSTDWNTTTNWTPNNIPAVTDNVVIPSGRPNYPVITTEGLSINNSTTAKKCKSLHISSGGSVTVNATGLYVYVQGELNISGTFNHQCGDNSNYFRVTTAAGIVTVKNGGILNVGSSLITGGVPAGTIDVYNDLFVDQGKVVVEPGGTLFVQDAMTIQSSGNYRQEGGLASIALSGAGSTTQDKVSVSYTSTFRMLGGTFRVSGDADGATSTYDAIYFAAGAGGTIDIQDGTIELSNGTTSNDFTLSFAKSTTLANLTINKSGKTVYIDGYDFSIAKDISISAGTFNTNNYNLTAAGNWTNNGTFTPGSGTVTFTGSGKQITGTAKTTFNNLTFNNGSSYSINPTSANPNERIDVNSTFILNTGASIDLASGKRLSLFSSTNTFNGTVTTQSAKYNNGTTTTDYEIYIRRNNTLTGSGVIGADILFYKDAGIASTTTLGSNLTIDGSISIHSNDGGATLLLNGKTVNLYGSWTNSGIFDESAGTSTLNLYGSGMFITGALGSKFYNLNLKSGSSYTINPSGTVWPDQSSLVNGNYNAETGSILTITTTKVLDLYGSSIIFNGTTTTSSVNDGIREIDINNTANLSGNGSTTADLRIYSGTTTLISDFILNGGFEIRTTAGFTMSTHIFSLESWKNRGTFTAGTATVKFIGTGFRTVDANCYYNGLANTASDFYNVTIDRGSDTLAMFNTPMRVVKDFLLKNGIFSTGYRTNHTGNVGHNRRLTVLGIASVGAGTTFFVGYKKACDNSSEALLTSPGCAYCTTCNPDSLNVPVFKGDFINLSIVRTNRPVISAYMDIKLAGARITGTGVPNEFGCDFQVETAMSATQVGPVDIEGDLIVQDNTSFINTDPNNVLTVRGNFYMYYNLTHNGTVNCYRDFTSGSTGLFTPNTVSISNSIFNFYQTGVLRHIFLKTSATNPIFNFGDVNIIAGTGNVRELRQRISVSGNLVIQSGTLEAINSGTTSSGGSISPTVGVNDASIVLSGNTSSWTNNGIFTPHSDTVTFSGSSAQLMGGNNATTFYNLTVNKGSSSEVSFANVGTVTNVLSLINGYIVTDAAKLLVMADQSSVSPAGGQSGSFVRGPVKKVGRDGVGGPYGFIFPVGKNNIWARLHMVHFGGTTANTDAFTSEYFDAGYGNYAVNSPLNHVSSIEYWNLSKNSGDATLKKRLRLYSEDNTRSMLSAFNNADLTVAHWNGTKWDDIGYNPNSSNSGGSLPAGWISSEYTSNFSPFTFGSKSAANPLPIELLSFTAKLRDTVVDIFWSTASEINSDYFIVQRSQNFSDTTSIANIDAAGISNSVLDYYAMDSKPLPGISYYRLKEVDFDGSLTYSDWVKIEYNPQTNYAPSVNLVTIYPNPTNDNINVVFNTSDKGNVYITVFDIQGKLVKSAASTFSETGNTLVKFDVKDLPEGIYFIRIANGNSFSAGKFIKTN